MKNLTDAWLSQKLPLPIRHDDLNEFQEVDVSKKVVNAAQTSPILNNFPEENQSHFFRSIVDNIAEFVAVLDPQGRRLYNNSGYDRHFGCAADLVGTDSFMDVHPDDRDYVRATFIKTVETGICRAIEYRLLLSNGSIRHMQSQGSVVFNAAGAVMYVIVTAKDITNRKLKEDELKVHQYLDELTSLPNRRLLIDRVQQEIKRSKRTGQVAALLFFDLDGFKGINYTFGHSAGDRILCSTAYKARSCLRANDTVARLGGDEFVILAGELGTDPQIALRYGEEIATRLLDVLREPHELNDVRTRGSSDPIVCGASVGLTLVDGQACFARVLEKAEAAAHQAKLRGGNYVCTNEPS